MLIGQDLLSGTRMAIFVQWRSELDNLKWGRIDTLVVRIP
jgi:hypothetical protein